ncbi:recombinase family protein [Stenotrophomonas sp. MMGLT7]|uniref:recombinase family protein n=1 Tax=Stenotrophomonas sp. MMGLT7 TaxID=2901227 RepID=UPI001E646A79|nr:recombinase family protein [Stenotrophomonas sp. MMGLT7]MCD7096916.1 recombinase family protein [Stenotrophomonas sp. MMGLT7]
MRALGYIRVSTEEQASNGHSLEAQHARLQAWCVARDLELVDVVIDAGVSAGKPLARRKGGADLLRRMAAGAADVVVVVAIDRMFRDAQDGLNTLNGQGGQAGMAVQSVTEPLDTTSAMGRFILTVWLARAQLEREQTCERNLAISSSLRAAGRTYGSTPYGTVARDGRLYRDPRTWPHRELIVALRAGQGGARPTLDVIARELYRRGIPSPDGAERWQRSSINRVVRTHGGLNHIPALPAIHETAVSEAAAA